MSYLFINRGTIIDFIGRLRAEFDRPGRLFLIGETSQVFEGWRPRADELTYAADIAPPARPAFDRAVEKIAAELGIDTHDEHPGTLIPLPAGYQQRARRIREAALAEAGTPNPGLEIYHFDPYSVSFRYISRGDEPDYHIVLYYLQNEWVTMPEMEQRLEKLLPEFTFETIAQDPAEFRRKFKGLQQMWQAIRPGITHRPTPV